jgi:hypothetical protein
MQNLEQFSELVENFADSVDFIIVYLSEAHPTNEWKIDGNFDIYQHVLQKDRIEAGKILEKTIIEKFGEEKAKKMPIYLDLMTNEFSDSFAAHPERLLVIDNRTLTFYGGTGPFFYSIPELRQFLESNN